MADPFQPFPGYETADGRGKPQFPVPEPAAYGAALMAVCLLLVMAKRAGRRLREHRAVSPRAMNPVRLRTAQLRNKTDRMPVVDRGLVILS
jgi:hypothetical protein